MSPFQRHKDAGWYEMLGYLAGSFCLLSLVLRDWSGAFSAGLIAYLAWSLSRAYSRIGQLEFYVEQTDHMLGRRR